MPYKMEDLVYPGGQPAKTEHKPTERKPSMGVLDMLENMGRTEKARPVEEPTVSEPVPEPKPEPKERPVATMPKITKQEEPKRQRFGATPETSKDLYDKQPVEEPKLDYKRFFEPKAEEPKVEEPKPEVSCLDDYLKLKARNEYLEEKMAELEEKKKEEVNPAVSLGGGLKDECEFEYYKTEPKGSFSSDGAVKVALDVLKILVLACVGIGVVALVVKGIMMLFGI